MRPLWGAGPEAISWDAAYNEPMDAVTFTIDDAPSSHVELFTIISGHGAEGPQSCAEFCAHQQEFAVNDTAFPKEYAEAGTMTGCMDKVSEGVVPNQFGTWPYGRAGWCPGRGGRIPWGALGNPCQGGLSYCHEHHEHLAA